MSVVVVVDQLFAGEMENMQGVNTANQLMDSNGNPTPLGSAYLNVDWS